MFGIIQVIEIVYSFQPPYNAIPYFRYSHYTLLTINFTKNEKRTELIKNETE